MTIAHFFSPKGNEINEVGVSPDIEVKVTDDDIAMFFATDWKVHFNSNRTGVRLIGPKPVWDRC